MYWRLTICWWISDVLFAGKFQIQIQRLWLREDYDDIADLPLCCGAFHFTAWQSVLACVNDTAYWPQGGTGNSKACAPKFKLK